jgi:ribosomal protein S18 acetylase RimI-like enzyme
MTAENTKRGVVARSTLTEAELAGIKALADICASYDGIDLRLSWNELGSQAGDVPENLLYYQDGALIGFLALAGIGDGEAEATGITHPRYRRQGVFSALVSAAREICRQHHTHTLMMLFDRRSDAARAFLTSIGAEHAFSEHKMQMDTPPARSVAPNDALDFQPATLADADAIAQIIADDSGMDANAFRQVVARGIQDGTRQYYLARMGGEPIGTINVDVIDGQPYIYGFVVVSEQRGRGYGRQMLAQLIERLAARRPGPVFLEVETDNQTALALYHSFSFTVTHTYDYYQVKA